MAGNQKKVVSKILARVSKNPLPSNEGGYGEPLRNNNDTKFAGLLKIKLKKEGIRIVYKVIRTETEMLIIVIGARADDEVYEIADTRVKKYNLRSVGISAVCQNINTATQAVLQKNRAAFALCAL